MTRPRCSHLKLDDVARLQHVRLSWCLSLCECLCQPVCTDRQTTHRLWECHWLRREVNDGKGRGRWAAINTKLCDAICPTWRPSSSTIPLIMNDPCQNNWLPCSTQWWRHTSNDWLKRILIHRSVFYAVPLAMQAYLYVLNHAHERDSGRMPVWVHHYTHSFSVDTQR